MEPYLSIPTMNDSSECKWIFSADIEPRIENIELVTNFFTCPEWLSPESKAMVLRQYDVIEDTSTEHHQQFKQLYQ